MDGRKYMVDILTMNTTQEYRDISAAAKTIKEKYDGDLTVMEANDFYSKIGEEYSAKNEKIFMLYKWTVSGKNIFDISSGITDSFVHTDVSDIIESDIMIPYGGIYISVPQYTFTSNSGYIDGFIIVKDWYKGDPILLSAVLTSGGYFMQGTIPLTDGSINRLLDGDPENRSMSIVFRVILNALTYITTANCDVVKNISGDATSGKRRRKRRNKKRLPLRMSNISYVGHNFTTKLTKEASEAKGSIKVRGHFRWQPFGKRGLGQVKRIFIEPFYKNFDYEKEETTIYS